MAPRAFSICIERWPINGAFVISRGAKTQAVVITVTLEEDGVLGRGECVPYPRYGETPEATKNTITDLLTSHPTVSRAELQHLMAPSAARNAIDCALWDLEAKQNGTTVRRLLALPDPEPKLTCRTISLASPEQMATQAASLKSYPLLKLKLGGSGDPERMKAVRRARPDARLVVDANESWTPEQLPHFTDAASETNVEVIEQPLAAAQDEPLETFQSPIPLCADESAHTADTLAQIATRYQAVNIKLDKTGGLTGALEMAECAKRLGLKIMVGCMVSTSLSIAPALMLSETADWIDLDGPILLAEDRSPGLIYNESRIFPSSPELWG